MRNCLSGMVAEGIEPFYLMATLYRVPWILDTGVIIIHTDSGGKFFPVCSVQTKLRAVDPVA